MNKEVLLSTLNKNFLNGYEITYYIVNEGKINYNLHFFCCFFDSQEELNKRYSDVNESIAFEFQSNLKKNIEKWNIYIFYFVKNEVFVKYKLNVEQDKYSTRKYVIDNVGEQGRSIDFQKSVIEDKLMKVNIEFSSNKSILINQKESEKPEFNKKIKFILDKINNSNKNILIEEYLGVNEDEKNKKN